MAKLFPYSFPQIDLARFKSVFLGSALLLCGTVTPAAWESPVIPRPAVQIPRHPWIALTFDDGPHPKLTEALLAVLRRKQVPGTFFIVGKMGDRYPNLLEAIAHDGHEVANHTYNHPRLSRLDGPDVLSELNRTRATIRRVTGRDSYLFRPPGGDYTRRTLRVTSKAGYKMVLWSVMTNDVVGASRKAIRRRIEQGADDGGIILMHSGVERTIEVLPGIIDLLRERGYHFVTVSTLLGLPSSDYYLAPYNPIFQTASVQRSNPRSDRQ